MSKLSSKTSSRVHRLYLKLINSYLKWFQSEWFMGSFPKTVDKNLRELLVLRRDWRFIPAKGFAYKNGRAFSIRSLRDEIPIQAVIEVGKSILEAELDEEELPEALKTFGNKDWTIPFIRRKILKN